MSCVISSSLYVIIPVTHYINAPERLMSRYARNLKFPIILIVNVSYAIATLTWIFFLTEL